MVKRIICILCLLMLLPCACAKDVYPTNAEEIYLFQDGLARVCVDGKYGFIDTQGNYVIEPKYDGAEDYSNGYALVYITIETPAEGFWGPGSYNLYGLVDTQGREVLPTQYDAIDPLTEDGLVHVNSEAQGEQLFSLTPDGAQQVRVVGNDLILEDYMPFSGEKVAQLNEAANLVWNDAAPLPRLDGATALFPVYSAVVQATYPEDTRYGEEYTESPAFACTKTTRAYERLISGDTDIIFCAEPSDAQVQLAKEANVEFQFTPFGKEAFVFFVNRQNPLETITVEEIQRIYSGELTRWEDVGVSDLGDIIAYQRPENSGSQTALEKLMGDIPIMTPPSEYVSTGMEDILNAIEYRNLPNAIGYSFRFFCTEMIGSDVKLLSIDGCAPTEENIRSGAYPVTSTLYMVTRRGEENPNVQLLLDWVLSDQGRELIEKSGYVALQ